MADETKPPCTAPHRGAPAAPAPAHAGCTRRTRCARRAGAPLHAAPHPSRPSRRAPLRRSIWRARRRRPPRRRRRSARAIRTTARRSSRGASGWAWPGARSPRRRPRRWPRPAASCSRTCSTSRRSSSRRASRPSTAWASTSAGRTNSASGSCARPTTSSHRASGFYALITTCTHLGCTPNYLAAEASSSARATAAASGTTGINFEGPAPRPLERARIVLADDGQILIDKSRKFQYELGQWIDPEAFLQI